MTTASAMTSFRLSSGITLNRGSFPATRGRTSPKYPPSSSAQPANARKSVVLMIESSMMNSRPRTTSAKDGQQEHRRAEVQRIRHTEKRHQGVAPVPIRDPHHRRQLRRETGAAMPSDAAAPTDPPGAYRFSARITVAVTAANTATRRLTARLAMNSLMELTRIMGHPRRPAAHLAAIGAQWSIMYRRDADRPSTGLVTVQS